MNSHSRGNRMGTSWHHHHQHHREGEGSQSAIVSPTRVARVALGPSPLRMHTHEYCGDAFVAALGVASGRV